MNEIIHKALREEEKIEKVRLLVSIETVVELEVKDFLKNYTKTCIEAESIVKKYFEKNPSDLEFEIVDVEECDKGEFL